MTVAEKSGIKGMEFYYKICLLFTHLVMFLHFANIAILVQLKVSFALSGRIYDGEPTKSEYFPHHLIVRKQGTGMIFNFNILRSFFKKKVGSNERDWSKSPLWRNLALCKVNPRIHY